MNFYTLQNKITIKAVIIKMQQTNNTSSILIDKSKETIHVITINRAHRRNAVDRDTAAQLRDAFLQFEEDPIARVAILTSEGQSFCAGADLQSISDQNMNVLKEEGSENGPMGPTRLYLSKPVIAAIKGYAVAGGLELACWCSLRVASSDAIFGVFCRRFGVPLIDGGTVRLPQLIGYSRAMDMILTGRPIDAKTAYDWGLVNRLVDQPDQVLPEALKLATLLCSFPQKCMRSDYMSTMEATFGKQNYDQQVQCDNGALYNEFKRGLQVVQSGETLTGSKQFKQGVGRGGSFNLNSKL
jgi:enoyl-CoA hydratase